MRGRVCAEDRECGAGDGKSKVGRDPNPRNITSTALRPTTSPLTFHMQATTKNSMTLPIATFSALQLVGIDYILSENDSFFTSAVTGRWFGPTARGDSRHFPQ